MNTKPGRGPEMQAPQPTIARATLAFYRRLVNRLLYTARKWPRPIAASILRAAADHPNQGRDLYREAGCANLTIKNYRRAFRAAASRLERAERLGLPG